MLNSGFELRFPFRPTHGFTDVGDGVSFSCGDLTVSLKWRAPQAVLRIGPFLTPQEAEEFLPRVWGSLAWTAVTRGTGFTAEMTWSHLSFPDDPMKAAANVAKSFGLPAPTEPLDALGDEGQPCVIPIGKNYRFMGIGDARATVTEPSSLFGVAFVRALSEPQTAILYLDERLRTAVQLFSDSHREVSGRSRFLTYVIALEVLSEPKQKHEIAQKLIDEFDAKVAALLISSDAESDEHHALESLRKELSFRRETSLRSRIRHLVLDTLSAREDRSRIASDAVWAYDQRSALVHDGQLPSEALGKAAEISRFTLLTLLREKVGLPLLGPTA